MTIKKTKLGILLGVVVGFIDVVIMVIQNISWDANFSAFFHWTILGYLISITNLKLKGYLKGLFLSILTMIPIAFLAWWNDYSAIIPMSISTIIFGLLLGYTIEKYGK